jgi:hypothetical protein
MALTKKQRESLKVHRFTKEEKKEVFTGASGEPVITNSPVRENHITQL